MSDTLAWRELATSTVRRWWIPLVLAVVGAVLGVYAASNLNPVYRAQGTVLVGPLDSTVSRSTTLRASESLAVFYADMARREVVLAPVRKQLKLSMSLDDLRNAVSAVVPDQNPRVVTVTVESDSKRRADQIAQAVVAELISLSPEPKGVTQPEFVSAQADDLEATIQQGELDVDDLRATLGQTVDPAARARVQHEIDLKQQFLNDARQTYVELMSLEPDSDAGGLAVLDDVASVTQTGRVGPSTGALIGAVVGGVLGLLVTWLLDRRNRASVLVPAEAAPPQAAPTVNLVVRPTAGVPNRRLPRASPRPTRPARERPAEHVNGTKEP